MEKGLLRLLDANANRAREGLRVAEDVARLVLNDGIIASRIKGLRHRLTELCDSLAAGSLLLSGRDSEADLGRDPGFDSSDRPEDIRALVSRNMRRSEEACRVLEEVSALLDSGPRDGFKELRYSMYDVEKTLSERL